MEFSVRMIRQEEIPLMEDFLYCAIFQHDKENMIPREIVKKPEIAVFIEDFGKPNDYCLVAEKDEKIIGMVWTRILDGEIKGYGNIDSQTPEFAISVLEKYRGKGVGENLMKLMLALLEEMGYEKASLSVQKANYASEFYKKLGFYTVLEKEDELIMVYNL